MTRQQKVDEVAFRCALKPSGPHGLNVKQRARWRTMPGRVRLDRIACDLYVFMTIF
jgi:hypothetical protein